MIQGREEIRWKQGREPKKQEEKLYLKTKKEQRLCLKPAGLGFHTDFIAAYLHRNDTDVPGCINNSLNITYSLQLIFGPFIHLVPLLDLMQLQTNVSVMDTITLLGPEQLAQVATIPGQLMDTGDVNAILNHVPSRDLASFFDEFSPVAERLPLPASVYSALLQQIFTRANLSDLSISDTVVMVWLEKRLRPLFVNLTVEHVTPLFNIVRYRSCNTSQQVVALLSGIRPSLSSSTQTEIQHQILKSLTGSTPLRCYGSNSFIFFLKSSFYDFPLPHLTNMLALIPPGRQQELISTIHPSELGSYLRQPDVVDDGTALCTLFRDFKHIIEFLDREELPNDRRSLVLPCVWPLALSTSGEAEVNRWFDKGLTDYLQFLNVDLLNSSDTLGASCVAFKKLVSVLGRNNTNSSFTQDDAYNTIKTYLQTNGSSSPKCFNKTDPMLNSTDWFARYIGTFINHVTVDDLESFAPESVLQGFAVNPANIELFTSNGVPQTVIDRYTEMIYLENPNFNPLRLPSTLQCVVPASVYTALSEAQGVTLLGILIKSCTDLDPAISSALTSNCQTVNVATISTLGQASTGLSPAQITAVPPSVIVQSLPTLQSVSGWSFSQASTIIQALVTGNYQFNTASNLLSLGSLVSGLSTQMVSSIPRLEVLTTATNATFITNMLSATQIVQQTYVNQIIQVNSAPQHLLDTVPDDMAYHIPRQHFSSFTSSSLSQKILTKFNKKKWKRQQAVLFFGVVANGFDEPDDLSTEVLQGFTCSRIQTFSKKKIRRLIKACRRRSGRRRVILKETQLTCMYNNIKKEKPQDFSNYPSDMLLYQNYDYVEKANCKSYFRATGHADFDVLSSTLSGKKATLLTNAISCLGISGTNISQENVDVIGSMSCNLDQNFIQNSDSSILEKLKDCNDLSDQQIVAIENRLINGNTKYGHPTTWNVNTLLGLDPLPLYLRENFWRRFNKRNTRRFLKKFLRKQRKNKRRKKRLGKLFKQLRKALRSKRETVSGCPDTLGNITRVTISEEAFPYGYDATAFNDCLSAQVIQENLAELAGKVEEDEFKTIILEKLHTAFPRGLSDKDTQLLGSVSRMASVEQIQQWNVTELDTLAALMDSSDGEWDSSKSKVIITKYLSVSGNSLGSSELNAVGGPNLCSLDVSVLQGINNSSLKNADALDITNCSSDHKEALFAVAKTAFPLASTTTRAETDVLTSYQLLESYMPGADSAVVKSLSSANVSMSMDTFLSLNRLVIVDLTVSEVQGLLGNNIDDLKTYESHSSVQEWTSRQLQTDLDTLGLNMTGGIASNVAVATTTTATGTDTATTTTTTAAATTTVATSASCQCKATPLVILLSTVVVFMFIQMQAWEWIVEIPYFSLTM